MGPLASLLGMIPGLRARSCADMKVDERELDRIQAIILSMTPEERRRPELIKGSRRLRIAQGSGTNVQAVNQLDQAVRPDAQDDASVSRGKMPDIGALMRQAPLTLGRRLRPPKHACNLDRLGNVRQTRGSPAWAARRTRSGASSSPTSARRATAA